MIKFGLFIVECEIGVYIEQKQICQIDNSMAYCTRPE